MTFDGETYDQARDETRLKGQLWRVRALMGDGEWRTLPAILAETKYGSEASISARLRDLRKPRNGAYRVERRYISNGLWEYRMLPPVPRAADPMLVPDPLAVSMVPIPGWKANAEVR